MPSDHFETISNVLSTGAIIAIVISSIIGLAICIGFTVIIICLIKHCNRPRSQEMVLQPPYPHSWTTQYPPNTTSVANYPPAYQPGPPPYTASAMDSTKPPPYT